MDTTSNYKRNRSAEQSLREWLLREGRYAPQHWMVKWAKHDFPAKEVEVKVYLADGRVCGIIALFKVKDANQAMGDCGDKLRERVEYWYDCITPRKRHLERGRPNILVWLEHNPKDLA